MISDPAEPPQIQRKPLLPDAVRRRMLRSAAYAAPLIATIPSGAVRAQASTAQCIVKDRANAPVATVSEDAYVRRPALFQAYLDDAGEAHTVLGFPQDNPSTFYEADLSNIGVPANLLPDGIPSGWTLIPGTDRDVFVLKYYKPDNFDQPQTVTDICDVQPDDNGVTPTPPEDCLWQITTGEVGENQGMTVSCLCSVNPDLLPDGSCL